jgi:GNAT superfamily N-acetyltransferase
MLELSKNQMHCLSQLCYGKTDVELLACIEGNMGRAWVDNVDNPAIGVVKVADFCFLLGQVQLVKDEEAAIKSLLETYKGKVIMTDDMDWVSFIERNYPNNYKKFKRYMFKKEQNAFSLDRLKNFIMSVELEFKIDRIDEYNYYRVIKDSFMADCCCFFSSIDEFLEHGIGYIIERDGEIIAGASSYSFCKDNISVTIGTKDKYRRMGLATACASKLILECLDKNIYPRWDAANMQSVSLAEKLGYNFKKEYEVYMIS